VGKIRFGASETKFEAFPAGDYVVEVESMELVMSREKKTPMIKTVFTIESEETFTTTSGNEQAIGGRKIFHNFTLLPQSGWMLLNFLEAANVPHSSTPGARRGEYDIDFDTQDTIGKQCMAHIICETYQSNRGSTEIRNAIAKFAAIETS
jgi:hypothetical protein